MLSAVDVLATAAGRASAIGSHSRILSLQGLNRQEGAGHVVLLDVRDDRMRRLRHGGDPFTRASVSRCSQAMLLGA